MGPPLVPAIPWRQLEHFLFGSLRPMSRAVPKGYHCITHCDTFEHMVQAVSVRLDVEAMRALAQLEATGKSRSEAIRSALVEAASRLSDKESLAAEVATLDADEADRAEMLMVAELMESLRAAG
jgi:Arc/MetJ-type ribon-helix-helix transcriptional regulator